MNPLTCLYCKQPPRFEVPSTFAGERLRACRLHLGDILAEDGDEHAAREWTVRVFP